VDYVDKLFHFKRRRETFLEGRTDMRSRRGIRNLPHRAASRLAGR